MSLNYYDKVHMWLQPHAAAFTGLRDLRTSPAVSTCEFKVSYWFV